MRVSLINACNNPHSPLQHKEQTIKYKEKRVRFPEWRYLVITFKVTLSAALPRSVHKNWRTQPPLFCTSFNIYNIKITYCIPLYTYPDLIQCKRDLTVLVTNYNIKEKPVTAGNTARAVSEAYNIVQPCDRAGSE